MKRSLPGGSNPGDADLDFANIRAYPPGSHCGIIVLRLKGQDKPTVLRYVRRLATALSNRSPQSELWIIDGNRNAFGRAVDPTLADFGSNRLERHISGALERTLMLWHHSRSGFLGSFGSLPVIAERRLANSNRIAVSASWMVPASHRTKCRPKP
jgi:hypothetical protein